MTEREVMKGYDMRFMTSQSKHKAEKTSVTSDRLGYGLGFNL